LKYSLHVHFVTPSCFVYRLPLGQKKPIQSDPRRNVNDLVLCALAHVAAPASSSAQISRSTYVTRPSRRTRITCAMRVPYSSRCPSVALLLLLLLLAESGGTRIVFFNSPRSRGGGIARYSAACTLEWILAERRTEGGRKRPRPNQKRE